MVEKEMKDVMLLVDMEKLMINTWKIMIKIKIHQVLRCN